MISFLYPHSHCTPPDGRYMTLVEEMGLGWNNTYIVKPTQDPVHFYKNFSNLDLNLSFAVPMTE